MKISHELPMGLLYMDSQINNYSYCLPHLLDRNEEYKNHFLKAKEEGRYVIMDNSLHELGEAYDTKRLLHWVHELEPDEFIVSDVWQNKAHTLRNAKHWNSIKLPKKTTKVAVVQANSYCEAMECYHILKEHLGYQKIAFSYGADWYVDEFPHPNPLVGKMMGRIITISKLYKAKVISDGDRVHLLGCALPQEFGYYADMPFIESIDTSNPVIHGLAGIKYEEYGLLDKLPHKVDKFGGDSDNWEIVLYNVNKFKEFIPKK